MESLLVVTLSNAVAAALLAVAAAGIGRICRRPSVRHALWLLVLLKLVTPPLVPLQIVWPKTAESEPMDVEPPTPVVAISSAPEPAEPVVASSESSEPVAAPETELSSVPFHFADVWMPLVLAVWLGGSLAWWTIAAVRLWKFQRLLRQAHPAPEEAREQARRLAALLGLRRCPPIAFVSAPLSPLLWALGLSPRILLPATLWQRLGEEQRDTLLAHELAHLRRGDHWVRRLEFLVLGLYWWHPVVWWARRRLQEAEEECCDARVVAVLPDAAPAYAAALVETVSFLSQTRAAALVGASGAAQAPLLKRRLTMILTAKPSSRGARAAFWGVVGMGALLLPLAPGLARTEAPKEPQREEAKEQAADSGLEMLALSNPHRKVHLLALDMQKCTSCHQPATVHSRDLQRKPQSWREAHDEIVRLMDEMRRLQSGFREAADRLPAAESNRDEQIEELKDEMELLKLQVRVKETRLRSAKVMLTEVRRRKDSMLRQNERVPGSIAKDDLMTAMDRVDSLTAEVDIKEVELQEAMVRLKQAERRLARLQQPAKQTPQPSPQTKVHDLGTFKHGTITEMRVLVPASSGKKPHRIVSVRSSSGALSARAEKKEIEPGEKGSIIIRLDAGRFVGVKTFTIFVQFEDGQPEMRMQLRAESVAVTSPPPGTPKQDKQAQLKELERKLQDLLKEVRDLQHEKRPDQPRDPNEVPAPNR